MARIRRLGWIATTVVTAVAAITFAVGANAFANGPAGPCRSGTQVVVDQGGGHSWRTGGFRSAGCRAWRHMHPHRLYARTPRTF